jgi:hypothetical protein
MTATTGYMNITNRISASQLASPTLEMACVIYMTASSNLKANDSDRSYAQQAIVHH